MALPLPQILSQPITLCRAAASFLKLTLNSKDVITKILLARCSGIIEGLSYRDDGKTVCPPKGSVTNGQMIRVVVKYIDDRPERQQEYFKVLALEAFRAAWPCKN